MSDQLGKRASALIIKDSKILLIHRKKEGEEFWVFPGGGVEDGETLEAALVREVKEETNLDVLHFTEVFTAYNERSNKMAHFFKCEVSDGIPEIIGEEKDKQSETNSYKLEWIELADIPTLPLVPTEAKEKVIANYGFR
jgi:8-oxo-dGTP diphosphatase